MAKSEYQELIDLAKQVLSANDRSEWTAPAAHLYPHQWLWDSCFIAIGLRHIDTARAQTELRSLLRGQWKNGMLPHMIFSNTGKHRRDWRIWRSHLSPYSPDNQATSGLTQPPMLAEAVLRVGQKLKLPERRSWYVEMYPVLLRHHKWLYAERNPRGDGLIVNVHPYETGMDNTPPWISVLRARGMPLWVRGVEKVRIDFAVNLLRRDTRFVPPGQRMSTAEAISYLSVLARLRRQGYSSSKMLRRPAFAIIDVAFNSMLVRANTQLATIAKVAGKKLPLSLHTNAKLTRESLENLWDPETGQYFSLDSLSTELIKEASIASLLPLYSGGIPKERAALLVDALKRQRRFSPSYPVPSVPLDSPYFDPTRYWQGPTWINMNWMIIDGLERYGYAAEASVLRQRTIALVEKSGCSEYFNPKTGEAEGASDFSWTAALAIDLLKN